MLNRWILAVLLFALSACGQQTQANDSGGTAEPGLVHVVLVWLKEPGNAEHRQQIIAGSKTLTDIPGVLDLRVGEVIAGERDVVEDSYDVGLYLRFASQADLQTYLTHPTHVTTVKQKFLPIMARYQVMDFQDLR